jgi:hypothetical protein
MTDTLTRPARSTAPRPTGAGRSPLQAGLTGAVWAVCAGLVATALPVLLVWAADGRSGSGAGAAMRAVGQLWLVAHGADLAIPGGRLGLTPLGLVALPLLLLVRAGGHTARECRVTSLRRALQVAGALAAPYAVLAAIVAAAAGTSQVQPVAWQALLGAGAVGFLGALAGGVRAAGLRPAVLPAVPERVARLVRPTAAALGVLAAGGALLTGGSLLAHTGRAADLAAATSPGIVGGLALLVLGLLLVPNAAVWGASWLAGPGFAVGVGTAVGPFGSHLGAVPALPLLAGLPGAVPPWVGVLAALVPVSGGVLAGVLVHRQLGSPSRLGAAREALRVGLAAGAVAALAAWLSGGPAGGARLTAIGPSPWRLGLAVALEVGLGAAVAAVGACWLAARRVSP